MSDIIEFFNQMGFMNLTWQQGLMILISFFLLYLAIKKQYEPLLLLPIAFGMLLANFPGANMYNSELWTNFLDESSPAYLSYGVIMREGGLLDILYIGVKAGIYPCLIFMGVGAMTDFGPLLANPKTFLLGAAAQFGVFTALLLAVVLGFNLNEAAAIGIIGGADGPTAIFLTLKLAPHLLGPIAVAAYSYMALVPLIQPPIMRWLTNEKERQVIMETPRTVSKKIRIIFPIAVAAFGILVVPPAAPLIAMLMGGNLMRESGVVDRLSKMAQNELMNIITFFLGTCVGLTMQADNFLTVETIKIILLGVFAFGFSTVGGLLLGKLMYKISGGKINPLIGSAGVSAVPMAARVSHNVGQEYNSNNYLLMHAMGPNVAGVIGTAIAAGVLISILG